MLRAILSGKKVSVQEQKDIVFSMVRILSQMDGDVVQELLEILAPYFGDESVLSIVETSSRSILATTQDGEDMNALRRTAASVKNVSERGRYIFEEKNGIFFRESFKSVSVFPFRKIGKKKCFLLVEQIESLEPSVDRCVELLEIAVRMGTYESIARKNADIDFKTKLPSRDVLISRMKENMDKEMFLGMFCLLNGDEIGLHEGIAGVDRVMCDVARVLEAHFPKRCFLVADKKIAVLIKGPAFKAAGALQRGLDELIENVADARLGCVLSPMVEEIYTAMYLCEKACEQSAVDVVMLIRNPEEFLNTGGEILDVMYVGEQGREVYEDFAERTSGECEAEDNVVEDVVLDEGAFDEECIEDDFGDHTFTYDWSNMFSDAESV